MNTMICGGIGCDLRPRGAR